MTPISGLTMMKIVMGGSVTSRTNFQKASFTRAAIGLEMLTVVGSAPMSRRWLSQNE